MREKTTVSKIRALHKIQCEALADSFRLGTLLSEKGKLLLWFNELNRQTRVIKALRGGR